MSEIKSFLYGQMRTAERQFSKKVHGNGYTKNTRTGRALVKEDVYILESPEDKLEIDDPKEVDSLDIDLLITALQSYQQNLDKAERIIRGSGSQGIAYEVKQIKKRVRSAVEEAERAGSGEITNNGVERL